jgi:uncharacterized protein (TIGR03435 family)
MRLMMQSLLADRFKMAVHWDKRAVPSFDLVLASPGKTGPQLQPHNAKVPCQAYSPGPSPYGPPAGELPPFCGVMIGGGGPRYVNAAGRAITIAQFADGLSSVFGRPVTDETGLTGTFDINLYSKFNLSPTDLQQFGIGDIRTAYLEGLREQLGLKLQPSKTSVDALEIDHIEEPSPN